MPSESLCSEGSDFWGVYRMRDGEYEEGQCVLRAKIDMAHKNVVMRDPIMYRILKKEHPRTGQTGSSHETR